MITLFFGSALLMALSDSEIQQKSTSTIDGGLINLIVYQSRRYWLLAFGLFAWIICVRAIEKVQYFMIAVEF